MMAGRPKKKPVRIGLVNYWRCSACGDYRPGKRFGANKTSTNGLDSRCKDCRKPRAPLGRPRRRPRTRNGVLEWRCPCCRRWKTEDNFGKRKPPAKGPLSWCKLCVRKDSELRRRQ